MTQGVIADNWSLQDVSGLFSKGLRSDDASEIVISGGKHSYNPVSMAVIQTEALFDFLIDLILRDEIIVDEEFTYTWKKIDSPILDASKLGVVRTYPFLVDPENLSCPREQIVERMCTTDSLKIDHQTNVDGWNNFGESPNKLLSQTLWGGAGMCARSYVYEKGYTPHPLRRRLFINTGFILPADDSLHQLSNFINDKRVKVAKKIYGNDALYSSCVNIPALPIRIIQEASSPDQMIQIALEMRNDFLKLREWLKMFQNAMADEDTEKLLKFRKQLDSVSEYVDRKIGYGSIKNPVSLSAGIGIFKISIKGDPVNFIKNQFGVRSTLNKLIFSKSGKPDIRRYAKMFGEEKTEIGHQLELAFTHSSKPSP